MKRHCEMCATAFEAKRLSARYCSDRCRQRARRAGAARPASEPASEAPVAGASRATATSWLAEKDIDPAKVPAAADLLVVAGAIDTATSTGQIHLVASLARQAAALRAELTARLAADEQEEPQEPEHADEAPERRPFDAAAL